MADFKVAFHPSFVQGLKEVKVNQVQFSELMKKIEAAASDVEAYTQRLRGLPAQFRKLNFLDTRVVLWHSKNTLYVLRIFHRRQGYSKESFENLLKLIREYTA